MAESLSSPAAQRVSPRRAMRHNAVHVQPIPIRRSTFLLRGLPQADRRATDGGDRNAGRPMDRGTSRIPPRAGRCRGRHRPDGRGSGRNQQPLPPFVDASVDQRTVQHRPTSRHPAGGGAAGCAACRPARRAPRGHGMPRPHAVGKSALGSPARRAGLHRASTAARHARLKQKTARRAVFLLADQVCGYLKRACGTTASSPSTDARYRAISRISACEYCLEMPAMMALLRPISALPSTV